jgi:hypothetical protein
MLTTDQVDHFRTFGFVVLRGYLADRTSALRTEADATLRDAYSTIYHERIKLTDGTGALRLVPGSHHREQNARLAAYSRRREPASEAGFAAYQASFPGYAAATSPGDVIAFDLHAWHASAGGRDRLAWNTVYLRAPETDDERDRTLQSAHDGFEQAYRGFDSGRYPVWRDWLAGAAAHPRRAPVIERMRRAGILDLPGALEGW